MATAKRNLQVRTGKDGKRYYQIQYFRPDGKRTTIRLGAMARKSADEISRHVGHLIQSRKFSVPLDEETRAWLRVADPKLIDKLARHGLCKRSEHPTVVGFVADFIRRKQDDSSDATITTYRNAEQHLAEFFGDDKRMIDVSIEDATAFRSWLINDRHHHKPETPDLPKSKRKRKRRKLGINTVGRRCGIIRQIFNAAVDQDVIRKNPFKKIKITVGAGAKEFVSTDKIEVIISHCPTDEWKLLFAIARYGGVRMPSEIRELTWNDIDWENNHILITSPKTAHEGKGQRLVPIFPEIRPHLERLFHAPSPGTDYVFPKLRHHTCLATTARKIVHQAKQTTWAKFWNSLRASRETELMDQYGLRRACAWIGNGPVIAMKNYSVMKKTDYLDVGAGDAQGDAPQSNMGSDGDMQTSKNAGIPTYDESSVGDTGLEPVTSCL